MADSHDRGAGDTGTDTEGRPETAAAKVNWTPTAFALGSLGCWVVLAFILDWRLPDLRDAVRLIEVVLLGVVGVVAVPPMVRQFVPHASPAMRRTRILQVYLAIAVPLSFGLFWSVYDVMTPVRVRSDGELPDIGSVIGRNQHDVARILGNTKQVGQAVLSPDGASGPARPGGANAKRLVVYSLPELNTLDRRPEKRAAQQEDSKRLEQRLESGISPAQWGSDAIVIVYFGQDSKGVGARMDLSLRSIAEVLSEVTSQTVLAAAGVNHVASFVLRNRPAADSSATTSVPSEAFWGSGTAGETQVGYQLQMGGLANLATERAATSAGLTSDRGDLTIVVAPGLIDSATMLIRDASAPVAFGIQPSGATSAAEDGSGPHGDSSHTDETFWIIICSKSFSTQAEALQRAKELNEKDAEKTAPHFAVERSGHLQGLGMPDSWFVIYDVGYSYEDDAKKAIPSGLLGFARFDARVVRVTKLCGDFTISKVVR